MTGLDAHLPPASLNEEELKTWQPDQIIEIAVIITNADLEVLHEGIEFVVRTDKVVLDRMGEW
jgi:oligoribonuclease (3'-5' exoribonuclease)